MDDFQNIQKGRRKRKSMGAIKVYSKVSTTAPSKVARTTARVSLSPVLLPKRATWSAHAPKKSSMALDNIDVNTYQAGTFPVTLHALIADRSKKYPEFVRWSSDGKSFFLETKRHKQLSLVLKPYFSRKY
jgi:hypothetical protein